MGDEQLPYGGGAGGASGVLGRQVHLFAIAMRVDVGLAEEQVGFGRELGEPGGKKQVAVPGGVAVAQGTEVEDAAQETGVRAPEEPGESLAQSPGAWTGMGAGGVRPPYARP